MNVRTYNYPNPLMKIVVCVSSVQYSGGDSGATHRPSMVSGCLVKRRGLTGNLSLSTTSTTSSAQQHCCDTCRPLSDTLQQHTCVHVHVHVHIYITIHVHIHTCMYVYEYIPSLNLTHVHVYIIICNCTCTRI